LGELFLKLVNELLAFRFGGGDTALQPPLHIPPRFILFDLLRPVVSLDFHLILNLPERVDNHRSTCLSGNTLCLIDDEKLKNLNGYHLIRVANDFVVIFER